MKIAAVRLSDSGYRWLRFAEPVPMRAIDGIVKRGRRRPHKRPGNRKAIDAMTAARRKLPVEDIAPVISEYINTDVSLAEIAERYGMTETGVRDLMRRHDPTAIKKRRAKRLQRQERRAYVEAWVELWSRCQKALDKDLHCRACGGWIIRNSKVTCSTECSEAYRVLRDVDDPDKRRRAQALVFLRRPDKYSDVEQAWARRMLSDNPPPRNRTFLVPGSERAEIIKKYRPERYAELTGDSA